MEGKNSNDSAEAIDNLMLNNGLPGFEVVELWDAENVRVRRAKKRRCLVRVKRFFHK